MENQTEAPRESMAKINPEFRSRFDYVKYDEKAASLQDACKRHMIVIELFMANLQDGRAKALALTKLEEAYMWIGKAIRDDQLTRGAEAPLQEDRKDG